MSFKRNVKMQYLQFGSLVFFSLALFILFVVSPFIFMISYQLNSWENCWKLENTTQKNFSSNFLYFGWKNCDSLRFVVENYLGVIIWADEKIIIFKISDTMIQNIDNKWRIYKKVKITLHFSLMWKWYEKRIFRFILHYIEDNEKMRTSNIQFCIILYYVKGACFVGIAKNAESAFYRVLIIITFRHKDYILYFRSLV